MCRRMATAFVASTSSMTRSTPKTTQSPVSLLQHSNVLIRLRPALTGYPALHQHSGPPRWPQCGRDLAPGERCGAWRPSASYHWPGLGLTLAARLQLCASPTPMAGVAPDTHSQCGTPHGSAATHGWSSLIPFLQCVPSQLAARRRNGEPRGTRSITAAQWWSYACADPARFLPSSLLADQAHTNRKDGVFPASGGSIELLAAPRPAPAPQNRFPAPSAPNSVVCFNH
jgi:hypothetical protein